MYLVRYELFFIKAFKAKKKPKCFCHKNQSCINTGGVLFTELNGLYETHRHTDTDTRTYFFLLNILFLRLILSSDICFEISNRSVFLLLLYYNIKIILLWYLSPSHHFMDLWTISGLILWILNNVNIHGLDKELNSKFKKRKTERKLAIVKTSKAVLILCLTISAIICFITHCNCVC